MRPPCYVSLLNWPSYFRFLGHLGVVRKVQSSLVMEVANVSEPCRVSKQRCWYFFAFL
jgi:hypothetical protein